MMIMRYTAENGVQHNFQFQFYYFVLDNPLLAEFQSMI